MKNNLLPKEALYEVASHNRFVWLKYENPLNKEDINSIEGTLYFTKNVGSRFATNQSIRNLNLQTMLLLIFKTREAPYTTHPISYNG